MALILTRRHAESVTVQTSDGPVRITSYLRGRRQVQLAIDAPDACVILREELHTDPNTPAPAATGDLAAGSPCP